MRRTNNFLMACNVLRVVLIGTLASLPACEGGCEEVGEDADEALEDAGEAVEDATDD